MLLNSPRRLLEMSSHRTSVLLFLHPVTTSIQRPSPSAPSCSRSWSSTAVKLSISTHRPASLRALHHHQPCLLLWAEGDHACRSDHPHRPECARQAVQSTSGAIACDCRRWCCLEAWSPCPMCRTTLKAIAVVLDFTRLSHRQGASRTRHRASPGAPV